MLRAVREKGSYEKIFRTYRQGSFQFASRNFYPEFLAAVRVAKRLAAAPGIPFERPEPTVTFRLKEEVPIDRLRSNFALSRSEFARLNPALRKPVLDGQVPVPRGYLVRLPKTGRIEKATAGTRTSVPAAKKIVRNKAVPAVKARPGTRAVATAKAPAEVRKQPVVKRPVHRTVRHTVRKGDTSFSIARQHQISPQDLMTANNRSIQEPIRIGETLIIPTRHSSLLHRKSAISSTN
jgi:membrane-bound lytic murein transglycosylase D